MQMKKQTIVKEDGRLLTYYWFTHSSNKRKKRSAKSIVTRKLAPNSTN